MILVVIATSFSGLSDADTSSYRLMGTRNVVSRPALGLKLGESSTGDIQEWASLRAIGCLKKIRSISCSQIDPRLIGDQVGITPIDFVNFSFDLQGHLESVDILRSQVPPTEATQVFDSLVQRLKHRLGRPSIVSGDQVEYHFKNYAALVSSTGSTVHERYLSGE